MTNDSPEFWQQVYQEQSPRLLGVCRRYVSDPELAEDLLHEGFLVAMQKAGLYRNTGPFGAWLRKVVVNTVLQHLRKSRPHFGELQEEVLTIADDDPLPAWEAIAEHLDQEQLLAAIDRLPDHHRAVFNLYVMEGFTHKQIGTMLNISSGTSKSHLARARRKLQTWLLEDAEQEKKKKRKLAFLWLFLWGGHPVDRAFQHGLGNLEIAPKHPLPMKKTPGGSTIPVPKPPIASKWSLVGSIAMVTLGASVIIYQVVDSKTVDSPTSTVDFSDSIDQGMFPSYHLGQDSMSVPKVVTMPPASSTASAGQATTPVVVKKQVVVRRRRVPNDSTNGQ